MNLMQYDDSTVCIHLTNEDKQCLSKYTQFRCTIAEVKEIIETYIVLRHTSYSLIMNCSWLWKMKAIDHYTTDEYWILSSTEVYYTVHSMLKKTTSLDSELHLVKNADWNDVQLNEQILVNINYTKNELC